jgi:hypothetical protein
MYADIISNYSSNAYSWIINSTCINPGRRLHCRKSVTQLVDQSGLFFGSTVKYGDLGPLLLLS